MRPGAGMVPGAGAPDLREREMTMTLTGWRPERPCPIPGHPQDGDGDDGPRPAPGSAWQRLRAWHLHAPAERLPLPADSAHLAGRLGPARLPRPRLSPRRGHRGRGGAGLAGLAAAPEEVPASAAGRRSRPPPLTAAIGGWVTAAVAWGPLGVALPAAHLHLRHRGRGGYWWLRTHRRGPRRPPAPRRPGRRDRRPEAVAPDPAPDRAGRLARAVAAGHQPG